MSDKVKSLQELAQEALQVQDACNLSGVAYGFARAMKDLCTHVTGTDARNTHPIAILWASKIADLTGVESSSGIAYSRCLDLAEGKVSTQY